MRGPSTSEFDHKHVRQIADGDDPFDVLAGEIARARRRLLSTAHNRDRGVIRASTILILTETQYQQFQAGVTRGYLQNHAYQCAVTVTAATDNVTYYGPGRFAVDYRLRSTSSIDDLAAYASAHAERVHEYQDTRLFVSADIYADASRSVRIASRVTGLADLVGPEAHSGVRQVNIYAHNANNAALSLAIQQGAPLFVASVRVSANARDWYSARGRIFS
jgi:hypothetical protein